MSQDLRVFLLVCMGLVLGLLMLGCTKQPEMGKVINPATIAQPDPVAPPVEAPPPPVAVAPPAADTWRAWIPREQTVNGDVIEGHYLLISPQGPALETVEPTYPMPRPPRSPVASAPLRSGKPATASSPPAHTPPTPSQSPPMLPLTPPITPQAPVTVVPMQAGTKPPTAYSDQLAQWQQLLFRPQTSPGGELP